MKSLLIIENAIYLTNEVDNCSKMFTNVLLPTSIISKVTYFEESRLKTGSISGFTEITVSQLSPLFKYGSEINLTGNKKVKIANNLSCSGSLTTDRLETCDRRQEMKI